MKKKNIWLRLGAYYRPFLWLLLGVLVLAVVMSVADWVNPYLTKVVMDDYIVGGNHEINVLGYSGIYLLMVVVACVSQYFMSYYMNMMGQKIIHNIRMEVFSHIQAMSFPFFDKNPSGSILTKATNDVEALSELYSGLVVNIFKDVVLLVGIIVVMLRMDFGLAMVNFSLLPLIILATYIYNKKFKANFRRIRSLLGRINAFFAENISGMRLVQVFAKEREKYSEFLELNTAYNKANKLAVLMNSMFRPASEFFNSLGIAILLFYGARFVLNMELEIGVLFAFITYSRKFFAPISNLADQFTTIQSASVSGERIFELLDDSENMEDVDTGLDVDMGDIEFRDVWFAYIGEDWVLKGVNFTIPAGKTTALVGSTGSGKSTIINLIGRFYEIQKGQILINGVDIKTVAKKNLRRHISLVLQDVFLFEGTVMDNIRLGNLDISQEKAKFAADYVDAGRFIEKLPDGFDSWVYERGLTLSAGQRQLISFARAIAYEPKLLILDEATANIDSRHEVIIQQSLKKMAKDHTAIIIAHRLSTIIDAHQILVLDHGELAQCGNHSELLSVPGIYRNLYQLTTMEGAGDDVVEIILNNDAV